MSGGKSRSPAIAAAIIFFGFTLLFLVMPSIVLWLAQFSTWLAAGFGVLAVLSFFLIFWLRARHQRRSNH
jgi:hypothetical protein